MPTIPTGILTSIFFFVQTFLPNPPCPPQGYIFISALRYHLKPHLHSLTLSQIGTHRTPLSSQNPGGLAEMKWKIRHGASRPTVSCATLRLGEKPDPYILTLIVDRTRPQSHPLCSMHAHPSPHIAAILLAIWIRNIHLGSLLRIQMGVLRYFLSFIGFVDIEHCGHLSECRRPYVSKPFSSYLIVFLQLFCFLQASSQPAPSCRHRFIY
jgi:hypothetical protein